MRAEQWRRVTDKVITIEQAAGLCCNDYPSINMRASASRIDFIDSTQKTRINAIFLTESY